MYPLNDTCPDDMVSCTVGLFAGQAGRPGMSDRGATRRLRLEELRRLWVEARRLPPPPPSLDEREAEERELHGGWRRRRPGDAEKLALLALEGVERLLEVVEWGPRARRLRLKGSLGRRGG